MKNIVLMLVLVTNMSAFSSEIDPKVNLLNIAEKGLFETIKRQNLSQDEDITPIIFWEQKVRDAQLSLATSSTEKLGIWFDWKERVKKHKEAVSRKYEVRKLSLVDVIKMDYLIAKADIEISKLK